MDQKAHHNLVSLYAHLSIQLQGFLVAGRSVRVMGTDSMTFAVCTQAYTTRYAYSEQAMLSQRVGRHLTCFVDL